MSSQHLERYRLPLLSQSQRQGFRDGAVYTVRANEAIHLMPAIKEGDEIVELYLDNLS